MKYFIDCEFHEYRKTPKIFGIAVGKSIPTVELISISIVSEDGRELYMEADWYDKKAALRHSFLKEHVLPHLTNKVSSRKEIKEAVTNMFKGDSAPELVCYWGSYDWWVLCNEVYTNMTEALSVTGLNYYKDIEDLLAYTGQNSTALATKYGLENSKLHNALEDARYQRALWNIAEAESKLKIEKSFSEVSHSSLQTLITHVFSRCVKQEDGTWLIPKDRAEKWLKRATTDYKQLTKEELRTPIKDSKKYVDVLNLHKS